MIAMIKKALKGYLFNKNIILTNYNYPNKKERFNLIKSLGKRLYLEGNEAYQLYTIVRNICKKQKGALAEVGMFLGGSGKLICEAKGNNPFYGFDTFEGLPKPQEIDRSKHKWECDFIEGQYKSDFEDVKNYLKEYKDVKIYKGLFPDSADKEVKKQKFIFIHLDVDIYSSTKDCLEFFYPKMKKGAVLLSHDYSTSKGIRKAFDEFFKNKPETVIELSNKSQCIFIKL
ncbi:macrocin-O-methyltransferase [archaeon BMS3Abin17]|nr:macrocin-O-methyltransferase [archaeon BMS3Abin17]HDZ61224.1 macrocin-O-methyltransferase [Candidatus Pacearchaeota archaeon]